MPRRSDHRTKVGASRRARTEERILGAALHVFAAKGSSAPVIDDFVKAADIARGTFYNYFRSTDELFDATAAWLLDDLAQSIDGALEEINDPVARIGMGIRLALRKGEQDRAWAGFMSKFLHFQPLAGPRTDRELKRGLRLKRLHAPSTDAALDLLVGTWRQAMERIASHPELSGYGDSVAAIVLQGLGADPGSIRKIIDRPLPEMTRPTKTIA
jgi:AcrR family transcriptional regulator